jgi:hypothetical protein
MDRSPDVPAYLRSASCDHHLISACENERRSTVSTFHIHDTNLHDPNRADRFRRDAAMHRLLKGSGETRRPTIGRRLSHALRRR